jgi:hypothetical protein
MLRFLSHRWLSVTAALALLLTASVSLADRDAGSKIRGEFGAGFNGRTRSYASRSYNRYSAPSQTVVRAAPAPAAPAPAAVAQAPSARRAFSYAPDAQAAAPQATSAAPTRTYYAPRVERRSASRSHVRSYERADAKFLGHVGY